MRSRPGGRPESGGVYGRWAFPARGTARREDWDATVDRDRAPDRDPRPRPRPSTPTPTSTSTQTPTSTPTSTSTPTPTSTSTSTAPRHSALAYDLATTWVLARRDLVRFFRQPSRLVGALGQPIIFWLVIGGGLSGTFRLPGA
ncbi:MAG TPA: hypothetical protein VIV57_10365, partial [Anaeromyxobacter sp.]